jgi:hypothetical protein
MATASCVNVHSLAKPRQKIIHTPVMRCSHRWCSIPKQFGTASGPSVRLQRASLHTSRAFTTIAGTDSAGWPLAQQQVCTRSLRMHLKWWAHAASLYLLWKQINTLSSCVTVIGFFSYTKHSTRMGMLSVRCISSIPWFRSSRRLTTLSHACNTLRGPF